MPPSITPAVPGFTFLDGNAENGVIYTFQKISNAKKRGISSISKQNKSHKARL